MCPVLVVTSDTRHDLRIQLAKRQSLLHCTLFSLFRYIHLEKELNGVCEPRKDAEVKEALEKLKQFVCVDNITVHHVIVSIETVPTTLQLDHTRILHFNSHIFYCMCVHFISAQEKLCLLVMSLPANHLCLQPVVSAIEVSSVGNSLVASYVGSC